MIAAPELWGGLFFVNYFTETLSRRGVAEKAALLITSGSADALRRARRLPVGPSRNDLRQLAMGLLRSVFLILDNVLCAGLAKTARSCLLGQGRCFCGLCLVGLRSRTPGPPAW